MVDFVDVADTILPLHVQRMGGVEDGAPPFHTLVGPGQFARHEKPSEGAAHPGGENEKKKKNVALFGNPRVAHGWGEIERKTGCITPCVAFTYPGGEVERITSRIVLKPSCGPPSG